MPNFGYEPEAPGTEPIEDAINGTKAPCPEMGTGVSITFRALLWTGGWKIKCCLYDAAGDRVINGETEERTTGGAAGWYVFNFPVAPALVAADYWIVVFSDNGAWCYYKTPGAGASYTMKYAGARVYELGFPASIAGLGDDYADSGVNIYCTYEVAAPPSYIPQIMMIQCSSIPKEKKIFRRFGNLWIPQLKKLWLPAPPVGVPKRIIA